MPRQRAGRYWSSKSSVLFTSFVTHPISSPMLRVGGSMCRVFGSKNSGTATRNQCFSKSGQWSNDDSHWQRRDEYAGKSDADVIQGVLSASREHSSQTSNCEKQYSEQWSYEGVDHYVNKHWSMKKNELWRFEKMINWICIGDAKRWNIPRYADLISWWRDDDKDAGDCWMQLYMYMSGVVIIEVSFYDSLLWLWLLLRILCCVYDSNHYTTPYNFKRILYLDENFISQKIYFRLNQSHDVDGQGRRGLYGQSGHGRTTFQGGPAGYTSGRTTFKFESIDKFRC